MFLEFLIKPYLFSYYLIIHLRERVKLILLLIVLSIDMLGTGKKILYFRLVIKHVLTIQSLFIRCSNVSNVNFQF